VATLVRVVVALRWVRQHLGLVAELAGYAVWTLADVLLGVSWLSVSSFVVGWLMAGIVLLRRRPEPGIVPVAVMAVGVSLAISVLTATALLPLSTAQSLFGPYSFVEQLALAVLVIAVLRRCELRAALLLAGAAAVAIVASPIMRAGDSGIDRYATIPALGWGAALAIGLAIREVETRRRAALDDARSGERMELARELHDVVAHHVTGIVVAAQAAAVVARTSPDDVDRALAAIEGAGTDALTAMRRMVGVLRGADGARTPGPELGGIAPLVERFDPEGRLVTLNTDPGLEHAVLPAGVAATGYRVVQEALTNVRRHAPDAARVEVDVRIREGALLVSVRNDGVPAAPATHGAGFGLAGMTERVSALDGTLTAGPSGAGVWTVAARVPLRGAR
jgi:signal transduction histidine kinase